MLQICSTKTGQGGGFLLKETDPQHVLTPEDFNDEITFFQLAKSLIKKISPIPLEPGIIFSRSHTVL